MYELEIDVEDGGFAGRFGYDVGLPDFLKECAGSAVRCRHK
jgi:hypothetical protein